MISKLLLFAIVCNIVSSMPAFPDNDSNSNQPAPIPDSVPNEEITSAQDNVNSAIDTTANQLTSTVLGGDTDDAKQNTNAEIVDKNVTTARDKIKSTLNAASQVVDKVQNRMADTLKTAQAVARETIAEQGKTIGDSVTAMTQLSQSGLTFISSLPKFGFNILQAFGR